MRILCYLFALSAIAVSLRKVQSEDAPPKIDGVYMLCSEVSGYSGETLELKDGKFRYWFYTDVHSNLDKKIDYPLSGKYTIEGKTLRIDHADIHSKSRTIDELNGVKILWRDDGLKYWQEKKRVHPYAVLIRAGDADEDKAKRPSIKVVYTQEMLDRKKKDYEERFNDLPEPARILFRASTEDEDPDMKKYWNAVLQVRELPRLESLKQLVPMISFKNPNGFKAKSLLLDLLKDDYSESNQKALVEALSFVTEREGLETVLVQFMSKSGINEMDLSVNDAGVQIRLERKTGGIERHLEEIHGSPNCPENPYWVDKISIINAACQKWCREQLAKRIPVK